MQRTKKQIKMLFEHLFDGRSEKKNINDFQQTNLFYFA